MAMKPKAKVPATKTKTVTKWLPVALTESKILDRARTMSQRCKEKEELEAEKASVNRVFGERLKKLTGEVARLSNVVSTGLEDQSVECSEITSYLDRTCTIVREDTGEVVETRPLYESELQVALIVEPEPNDD